MIFQKDNTSQFNQIIVNSYDPNDKRVSHEKILVSQVGDYLTYVIRFQNLGTASAINVRVEDDLDNHVDWESFRMLSASHAYALQVNDGNELIWSFDGINLPHADEDEPGSNGFIAFKVRTKTFFGARG